jgi:hypothetical protein
MTTIDAANQIAAQTDDSVLLDENRVVLSSGKVRITDEGSLFVEKSQPFKAQIFALNETSLQRLRKREALPASRLFHHQGLFDTIDASPRIRQKDLLNTLHHLHFSNGQLLVHVSEPQYREEYLLKAELESCPPGEITCRWPKGSFPIPDDAEIRNLLIADGLSLILFRVSVKALHDGGFTTSLPEEGYLLGKRRFRRHTSRNIDVTLTQNGFQASGELIDFTPHACRIRLAVDSGESFMWLNADETCMVAFREKNNLFFTGACRRIRHAGSLSERELVLEPIAKEIRRFQKRKQRTPRLQVTPPPIAHFEHPLFKRPIQLDICDLTFTGFAVEEKRSEEVLMAGMIIPGLEIHHAGALKMTCDAQVIYRKVMGKDRVRYGMAIIDMDFGAYRHLSHIMVHAEDPHARFSSAMEMDALWEFLFDTNFIYARKYHLLQSCRDEFKETYRKLYQEEQDIQAQFTYEKNGRVYGHVSIFRAYQRAWMVHHLAARPLNGKRTGLSVLKNVLHFFDGLYRYPSIGMDHMIFYFRPENHFPNLFFGGFARSLGNQQACSLDLFAYMNHPANRPKTPFPQGWRLTEFEIQYLPELERFYRNASGGLLLDLFRLGQTDEGRESLTEIYRRHGFIRQWRAYALLKEQELKALIVVNRSSPGLNLSELLNSLKVVVTDPAGLPFPILNAALARLTPEYETESVPLLIYPATYPSEQGLKVDKQYLLWILDAQYGKDYLDYMEKKTKLTLRFLFKYLLNKMAITKKT